MGLGLAELGYHTRCFVEWEEYPRSTIIAAQRAGYFAPAPIWDDLTTFDARPFAGAIDTLVAGYPCQPFSMAGKRLGTDDPRHLWPHVARVARELGNGLEWLFLENVAGHLTLGGEAVLRVIRDMGFTPATGTFSAAEVGAPHERQRWFCVAHPLGGAGHQGGASGRGGGAGADGKTSTGSGGRVPYIFPPGPGDRDAWAAVMAASPDRAPSAARRDVFAAALDFASLLSPDEADALEPVLRSLARGAGLRSLGEQAGDLVDEAQALARFCRLADGMAGRTQPLRLLGNGVHPLAAAHAWRTLASAHGLGPVDLEAAGGGGDDEAG